MPEDILASAIRQIALDEPAAEPEALTDSIVRSLGSEWVGISDRMGRALIAAQIRRLQRKAPDPRQLDLPGYERIPASILGESLEKYDADTAALEDKIRAYRYPRRSGANLKSDRQLLRERKRLRKHVAPLFARQPGIDMGKAIEMYRASLETPRAARNRKMAGQAIKARWDRKKGRTENQ